MAIIGAMPPARVDPSAGTFSQGFRPFGTPPSAIGGAIGHPLSNEEITQRLAAMANLIHGRQNPGPVNVPGAGPGYTITNFLNPNRLRLVNGVGGGGPIPPVPAPPPDPYGPPVQPPPWWGHILQLLGG